jgi:hypothetical protein
MCAGFAGNVIGRLFTGFQGALESKFDRIASMGKIHRCNAAYQSSALLAGEKGPSPIFSYDDYARCPFFQEALRWTRA